MFVGRSDEERELASESATEKKVRHTPTAKKPAKAVTLRLDRERDDHGDFFVAYLIRPKAPNDFLTFGSRKAVEAKTLAVSFAKAHGIVISRTIKTDSASEEE